MFKIITIPSLFFLVIGLIIWLNPGEVDTATPMVDSPKVIAHRGANDQYNESTIPAYEIAANYGVDALEIDLRMTEDGELIAMHDVSIDRTTTGTGAVSDYKLNEIKDFQSVEVFSNQTIVEEIPTLKEIMEVFSATEHYYIETRLVDGKPVMEEPLIEMLNEHELISKGLVTIQSFSQISLERIQELAPEIPLTFLFGKGKFNLKKATSVDYPIIGIESTDVTRRIVKELHKHGKEVHVFFTDLDTQKNEQERVKFLGVDGYFTDYIAFTKELLGKK
ncbi:glycerophosphodiester phosphodiesterase [Oceanobacillus rekensis]|uniref:glycerophosphodiester phosphodiesterase n=1 Tax=Oceanobacillus rekensis TaxID=937927 RepID=UPI000B43434A|nr:glycerophosphodiester phosphodiesterase family protein [Oceanobacillus rekensis]